jgi:hypothetical protein
MPVLTLSALPCMLSGALNSAHCLSGCVFSISTQAADLLRDVLVDDRQLAEASVHETQDYGQMT